MASARNEAKESSHVKPANPFAHGEAVAEHTIELPTATLGFALSGESGAGVAACLDGGVYRVGLGADAGEPAILGRHGSYASSVACLRERGIAVSGGYDGALLWHDLRERRTVRRVVAHRDAWSWDVAVDETHGRVASGGGRYLCGGYKYEPRPSDDPPVKVYDAASGRLLYAFDAIPPVESLAFSDDGRYLAAGNLMGEVRVWDLESGDEVARWTTPDFTGWGIIKGHYYTGGVFSMAFLPGGDEIVLAGMGTTRDPAAGNGRQLWQRFAWREQPARKVDETHERESGQGLMETVALEPGARYFAMGGRIARGDWNVGFFDATTGEIVHSLDTKSRVTRAAFAPEGDRLYLAGAVNQGEPKDGAFRAYGRIHVYRLPRPTREF
jgi:WD40 repeat protein